jgi:hypothetical protein
MIDFPAALSPLGASEDSLAEGPFVVERTDPDGTTAELGFHLDMTGDGYLRWRRNTTQPPLVLPSTEPVETDGVVTFESGTATYLIRPVEAGDEILGGITSPLVANPQTATPADLKALAEILRSRFYNGEPETPVGENNLYMTRGADGAPLALVKMSSSHPTLVRRDGRWDVLSDDENDLLGDNDIPVRESAVTTWDAGDMQKLEKLLLDDRFSPIDVTNVWVELGGDSEKIERLLIQRSRDRFYERTREGAWVEATPKEDAATVDVIWSAISAWDDGELADLGAVEPYDEEGDAA